jgi:hypothetical protein
VEANVVQCLAATAASRCFTPIREHLVTEARYSAAISVAGSEGHRL